MKKDFEKHPPLCNKSGSWHDGSCCCNCIHQYKLMSHPWNQSFGKGACDEQCGWVCTVQLDPELEEEKPTVQFFSFEHGFCEYHTMTDECKEYLKTIIRSEKSNLL